MRTVKYCLSDAELKALKFSDRPPQKPKKDGTMPKESSSFKVTDGGGMFVRISAQGTKTFAYAYNFGGRPRELTIGNYPEMKLAKARELHAAARSAIAEGRDPAAEKKEAKQKEHLTFRKFSERWLKTNSVRWTAWTHDRKEELLSLYAWPKFGGLPIEQVKPHHVLAAIKSKAAHPTTAAKLRAILKDIFETAASNLLVESNPAASMKKAITVPPVTNHPHLIEKDIGPWWNAMLEHDAEAATINAAKFIAFTLCRKAEVVQATWGEIEGLDGDEPVFIIPAARMKMNRDHIVPLPPQAVAVLRDQATLLQAAGRELANDEFIFSMNKKPINHTTLNAMFKRIAEANGFARFTPHGFRSTGATLLGERGVSSDVVELLLAHRKRGLPGIYNRALLLDQRRDALEFYADTLDALARGGGELPENPYASVRARRKSNVVALPLPPERMAAAA